jgi:DeoR/GlpR family transcriptional regulator of sugar metabolism
MLSEERRRWMLDTVVARGALSVSEAERSLAVSRMTVHRDLDVLAAQGLVRKVHGGVVAIQPNEPRPFDPRAQPFDERLSVGRDAKRTIARHVAKLVSRAQTLVLDASSTVYGLAEHLSPDRELFVVTGGLPLFGELARLGRGVRVALHGGEPHPRTGSLVGPIALASLGELRFDFAVISALGLLPDEGSVFISNPDEAEVKRAYLDRARKRILAIDCSKLGQSGAYKLGGLDRFDHVVTEKGVFTPADMKATAPRRRAHR